MPSPWARRLLEVDTPRSNDAATTPIPEQRPAAGSKETQMKPSVSVYHAPQPGPDGLCTLPGCGRVRIAHIAPDPRLMAREAPRLSDLDQATRDALADQIARKR